MNTFADRVKCGLDHLDKTTGDLAGRIDSGDARHQALSDSLEALRSEFRDFVDFVKREIDPAAVGEVGSTPASSDAEQLEADVPVAPEGQPDPVQTSEEPAAEATVDATPEAVTTPEPFSPYAKPARSYGEPTGLENPPQ